MDERNAPQSASAEEEVRIAEVPAVFANKIYVSPMAGGAKITFAEARSGESAPRVAVFLQHTDLAVLRRLLDWTGTDRLPEGGSMH